jgi:hypothetical protein
MFNQTEIFDRIKETMGFKLDKELANFFGITQSNLSTVKVNGTIPYQKILEKSIGNYNVEYIFFGTVNNGCIIQSIQLTTEDIETLKKNFIKFPTGKITTT